MSARAAPAQAGPAQHTVVPAAFATNDSGSYLWIAGASRDVRQQTLVGPSHLTALVGRSITAIELRRTAADETYAGGVADLTVTLSHSPSQPLRCSATWATNTGPDAAIVFQGQVTLPTSPPEVGPAVAWSPANTVRFAFTTPFVYQGGTLCLDVLGTALPGQTANWWMADAAFEDLGGQVVARGDGCGAYGGSTGAWSHVARRTLVPGGHAQFSAHGTPNGIAVAAFGAPAAVPLALTALGLPAPGCDLHLGTLDAMLPVVFEPETDPLLTALGGWAEIFLWIPDDAAIFGATLTTQWFEWNQPATSNALEWRVTGTMPTLDMAVIEGHPSEARGVVGVHCAHVLRFEHQ